MRRCPTDVLPTSIDLIEKTLGNFGRDRWIAVSRNVCGTGSRLRSSVRPNAGKSTLLNAIAGRDVAITPAFAGTTRDVIEVRLDLGWDACHAAGHGGLRETEDTIEKIGVERTRQRAELADLRVWISIRRRATRLLADAVTISWCSGKQDDAWVEGVSGRTGAGVDELLDRFGRFCAAMAALEQQRICGIGWRCDRRSRRLSWATSFCASLRDTPELAAEEIRNATRSLDSLTGRIDVEAVLGEIFSSFCIGK
jgi:tRNA modification GTPase